MLNLPQIYSATTDHLIASFLKGRSKKTIQTYRKDLEDFRNFLNVSSIDEATSILLSHGHGHANNIALAYKTYLIERDLQAATVDRRLAALRSLVKLARTLGMVPWMLEVENMRSESYRDTRGPGKNGFKVILNEAKNGNKLKSMRDVAILRLLYDLGLRRGELVDLDLKDLDLTNETIAVKGKGRTQKNNLSLPHQTKAALIEWLAGRGLKPGPLFINFDHAGKGQRLTGTSVYRIIRDLGKKAGINTWPHGLRHSAITEALEATGGNIRAVARFSRHKNIQTLMIYDDNRQDLGGDIARLIASGV